MLIAVKNDEILGKTQMFVYECFTDNVVQVDYFFGFPKT